VDDSDESKTFDMIGPYANSHSSVAFVGCVVSSL